MEINENDLFKYISDFYRTVDTKLNRLTQLVAELKSHITGIHAMGCDTTNLPPAAGHIKLRQDACLKLLKQVDAVLQQNGIKYWLGYGNLLGAARCGQFIPWDDDVDICLMRDDFNRAVTVLTREFNHGDFFTTWGASGGIFKVMMTRYICVDLFPWDFYFTRITSDDAYQTFTTDYMNAMNAARQMEAAQHMRDVNQDAIAPMTYPDYCAIRDDLILHGLPGDSNHGDIFEGIDWQTFPERAAGFFHNRPFRHEWIFPLGQIEFCGHKFPAPNNIEAWLVTRFGDWHEFRPEFTRHGKMSLTFDALQKIRDFIGDDIK